MGLAARKEVEEAFARPPVRLRLVETSRTGSFDPKKAQRDVASAADSYEWNLRGWLAGMITPATAILHHGEREDIAWLRAMTVSFLNAWDEDGRVFSKDIESRLAAIGLFDQEVRSSRRPDRKLLISLNKKVDSDLRRALARREAFTNAVRRQVLDPSNAALLAATQPGRDLRSMVDDIATRYPVVTAYLGR